MKRWPDLTFAESPVDRFLSAHLSNPQYNKLVWGLYPVLWRLGSAVGVRKPREAGTQLLGEEWGLKEMVDEIVADFIRPYVSEDSVVGEIGVGGARVASRVAPGVKEFYCFDVSAGMLKKAREALTGLEHVRYVQISTPSCPPELRERLNFVYAFDVFVHLDLHALWRYVRAMGEMLAPGGKALIHVANLKTPLGWEKFSGQKAFSVGGLYWVSPEIVAILADHAGLSVVQESSTDSENEYYARDYLAVLSKP